MYVNLVNLPKISQIAKLKPQEHFPTILVNKLHIWIKNYLLTFNIWFVIDFLASNISGFVGIIIAIFLIFAVTLKWCIIVVYVGKNCIRHCCNTHQVELQARRCPPPPYNTTGPHEALTTVPYPYPVLYSQQPSVPYQHCEAPSDVPGNVDIPAYESSDTVYGASGDDNVEEPYQEMKTVRVPAPPSYAELFKDWEIYTTFDF